MADISAALVMKLRKMSGQGMMDCKAALAETGGDVDEAMMLLRKKGLATMEKRAGRETSEGKVICRTSDDGKMAAMASFCCETDFVTKSDDFLATAEILSNCMFDCGADEGVENLLETETDGKKFSEIITETVSKTGEKTELGDYARFKVEGNGLLGTYVHFNGKIGSIVEIETSDDKVTADEAMKQLATDIAMHVAAIKPIALDETSIPPEIIEKEKAIAVDQAKNKPANIIDKIVEGKMRKFYAENCLVAQGFVKEDKKSVAEVLTEAAKAAGGEATIKRFVRFEIG